MREGKRLNVPTDRLLTRRERLRQRVWHTLKEAGVLTFPLEVFGRIPNFIGAEQAAELLSQQTEFQQARCIFVAPDHVLRRVRELVLEQGKVLAVSLPYRLVRQGKPALLQIAELKAVKAAAKVDNFLRYGRPLTMPVDLAVLASVVVDRQGHRLTNYRGFGDREWQRLIDTGLVHEGTKVATIVHPLQFAKDLVKWVTDKDRRVNLIVTPEEVIRCR